ncbi:uncharacterized protein TNCV_2968381 [Trichonephila clavipes]|nr:uncharacterized protein TNCV_2968381 [Trichonephila clavipes]
MVKSIARKRKLQFYGNKFTNTLKKNSTSAVPECTASCSKLGNKSFSTAEEMPGPVFGNRIVDLELIVEAFAQLCCPKCFAEKVELFEDSRYGLCSHFTLKYRQRFCGAFKLCSTLNLPQLTKTAYKNQEAKLLKEVQEVAEESMIKAATEIVEKKQNLSSDIVKCGISVDSTWQRRGYTSMNGCVAAISVDTDNLLALHFKYDQARHRFVEWAQNEIAVVPDFHKRILFSDEAHFWLNGYVDKQNCRIWSEANPQVYVETPLHREK